MINQQCFKCCRPIGDEESVYGPCDGSSPMRAYHKRCVSYVTTAAYVVTLVDELGARWTETVQANDALEAGEIMLSRAKAKDDAREWKVEGTSCASSR